MATIVVIAVWIAAVAGMLKLSAWVLGPLEQAATPRRRRLQFVLADWICLILMIQAWVATVHSVVAISGIHTSGALFADIYGWVLL